MSPLFNEAQPIPLHAIAAMVAVIFGGLQFYMKKGGLIHKLLGWTWVGLMLFVSVSSFFIHEIKMWGAYSPIHLLSLLTIFVLGLAIYFVRAGYIKRHKHAMATLYSLALIVAGIFTFMPGRVMHQVAFGWQQPIQPSRQRGPENASEVYLSASRGFGLEAVLGLDLRGFTMTRDNLCNFLTVALIILLSALGTSVSANAMWYLCGDKAVRLNLNDQSVSISRFGTPKPLSSNTMPTSKIENGFWMDW